MNRSLTALLAGLLSAALLSGCVAYHARPLPGAPDWIAHPKDAAGAPLRTLDMRTATLRALRDNPGYRAALRQARISALQLRQAGLLPDPQFSASLDRPTTPGYTNGWSVGLTEDLGALVTRGAHVDAARYRDLQQRLQLLWKGWSLAQQAAADYVALWDAQQRCDLLDRQVRRLRRQQKALDAALADGHITRQRQAAGLTGLSQAEAQLEQARQDRATARLTLNGDLDLAPTVHLKLRTPDGAALPDSHALEQALQGLPKTRPDLLALAAGYHASDADFRAAVLGQFPGVSVNLNRASDTSDVLTDGFGISLKLPLFGHAQTQARIARATRNHLYAAYQARLDAADTQARALYARLREVQRRARALARELPRLRRLARAADRAFNGGHFSAAEWISVHDNLLARELEALQARATLAKGRVALAALLGHAPAAAPPDNIPQGNAS